MSFKVGDVVEVITNYTDAECGDIGIINRIAIDVCGNKRFAVEFNISRPAYHTCQGSTRRGRGYWLKESEIRIVSKELFSNKMPTTPLVVIYEKDGNMIALDKRTNKRGIVKKNGDYFAYNAILALMELDNAGI